MPLYLVTVDNKKRVIKASTSAGARNHVLKNLATVKQIDAEEAFDLAEEGVKVETAGEDNTPPPPPAAIAPGNPDATGGRGMQPPARG